MNLLTLTIARDTAGLTGVALISYGFWLAYPPAGFAIAGLFLIAGAILTARGARR